MADYRGTCSKCRYYDKSLYEVPCNRCFRSMFHPCWEPGKGAEKSPTGGYIYGSKRLYHMPVGEGRVGQ